MPIQGDLLYANPANQYVGSAVDEIKALNKEASNQYTTNKNDVLSMLEESSNLYVEDRNIDLKKQHLNEVRKKFEELAKNGNYQDADAILYKTKQDFINNRALQEALKSGKLEQSFYANQKKRLDEGKISKDEYEYSIINTRNKNKNPLIYNPDTLSAENMFSGQDVLDNKTKEIYDKTYQRINDWKADSVPITVDGRFVKYDKGTGLIIDAITGKSVKESEVFKALKTEVENEYGDFLKQSRNVENFKKFYIPETQSYRNVKRDDIPISDESIKDLMSGVSSKTLKELENKANSKNSTDSDRMIYEEVKKNRNLNLNDNEVLQNVYSFFQKERQLENFVKPASSKAGFTEYSHHFSNDEAAKLALEHKYKKAEEQYKNNFTNPLPTNYSGIEQYGAEDYQKSILEHKENKGKINELKLELNELKKDPINNQTYIQNIEKQLKNLEYINSVGQYKQYDFIKKLSTNNENLSKEYIISNIDDLVNQVQQTPFKYSSVLNGYINQLRPKINFNENINNNIQSATSPLMTVNQKFDRVTSEKIAELMLKEKNKEDLLKVAINKTDENYDNVPATILNAIEEAKVKNPNLKVDNRTTIFGIDENSDKAWDREIIDRTASLVKGNASDWKIGNVSLDEIVSNPSETGFNFVNIEGKAIKPGLSNIKIKPEIGHFSGLNTVSATFFDDKGNPLYFDKDKKSIATVHLTPGDQEGIGVMYDELSKKLITSNDSQAKRQGIQIAAYRDFAPYLHNIHNDMMSNGEEVATVLPTTQGEKNIKIISGGKRGFKVEVEQDGKFIPFILNDYNKKSGNTFGSKEQFEELLKLNGY